MIEDINLFLKAYCGKQLYDVCVGPAGVHFDFGSGSAITDNNLELSILSNTSITIHSSLKHCLFACGAFPPFSCQAELRSILLNRCVTVAEYDPKTRGLRTIMECDIILSLIPGQIQKGIKTEWSIHSHSEAHKKRFGLGFLVDPAKIQRIQILP